MEQTIEHNTVLDNENEEEQIEFSYNFISIPWDDRTNKSKIFVILLLISIFFTTMTLVFINFHMHYKRFSWTGSFREPEVSCYRLRVDELPYVARFHSAATNELLCLGAVVSPTSILINGICIISGPLRMLIGSMSEPRCRKGFSVDILESVYHPSVLSKKLILLSTYEDIHECSTPIKIGHRLNLNSKVHIIGRPYTHGRVLSRQQLPLAGFEFARTEAKKMNSFKNYTIVVKEIKRCPVRAGDLMIQNEKLYGLAAYQRNRLGYFASLDPIKNVLREIDGDINK